MRLKTSKTNFLLNYGDQKGEENISSRLSKDQLQNHHLLLVKE